jgi:hypothetical protein
VLESGDQSDPSLQDPLRSRAQIRPTTGTEKARGEAMTGLAKHAAKVCGIGDRKL